MHPTRVVNASTFKLHLSKHATPKIVHGYFTVSSLLCLFVPNTESCPLRQCFEMATTSSSHLGAPVPQSTNQTSLARSVIPEKRRLSQLYCSSYGEFEGTPTPKQRTTPHTYPNASFSSGSSRPTVHSTPPAALAPVHLDTEDSGDEFDEVYDQFDLGDFTKEEIKLYESMVGPGERLRDAAPPATSLAEMLEASCEKSPGSHEACC